MKRIGEKMICNNNIFLKADFKFIYLNNKINKRKNVYKISSIHKLIYLMNQLNLNSPDQSIHAFTYPIINVFPHLIGLSLI